MQPTPTPPRLHQIILHALLWIFGFLAVLFIGLPLGMLFPYLSYLALYHTDRLLPFTTNYFQSLFSDPIIFLVGGVITILFIGGIIRTYRTQSRQWHAYQANTLLETVKTPNDDDSVPLPPPAAVPLMPVVIKDRLTLSLFLIIEACWIVGTAIAYIAWSQVLFRWPLYQNLEHAIIGSAVGLFLIGSVITLWRMPSRRIVVDHVGITVKQRKQKHMIFWSDVRQIVLLPTNMNKAQGIPAENYQLLTAAKPFDLQAPRGNSTSASQKRQAIREAIALAMHETHLPLVVDQDALQKRNIALDAEESSGQRAVKYSIFLLSAVLCLGFAGGIGFSIHPNPVYHSVAGQLAHYSLAGEEAKIQLTGDNTTYFLSTNGVSPYPPQTLPNNISIMMQVDGTVIGVLDANNATIQWHIVTQSYAEPWSIWIELGVFEALFLIPCVGLLFAGMRGFWRLARSRDAQTANSDIFPPREAALLNQDAWPLVAKPYMTRQQLHRYARHQGISWGATPKDVRDGAYCFLGGGIGLCLCAVVLALIIILSPGSKDIGEIIGVIGIPGIMGIIFLRVGITWRKKWRTLQIASLQQPVEIEGRILTWSAYISLMSSWLETLIQVYTDDEQEYVLRIPAQFLNTVRQSGARIRVSFIPETAYVTSVVRAAKVESIVVSDK